MNLLQETKDIQYQMAAFCRTGEFRELPGLTPNRFHHYRRLVYNVILDNLESAFPIAYEYIENDKWQKMVFEFFSRHKCQSYQVWQIAGEFCEYAISENFAIKFRIPYLHDLLRFEWEEMAIYNMEDLLPDHSVSEGDPLKDYMILNHEHQLLQLEYPVHMVSPLEALEKKGNYFVLLYREPASGKIQFIDLSAWYALVVEQLVSQELTLKELLDEAPKLFGDIDRERLMETTLTFIEELRTRNFILGFKNINH